LIVELLRVISKKVLFEKASRYADAKMPVQVGWRWRGEADWKSLEDIQRDFPATDMVGPPGHLHLKGNSDRLIARVVFRVKKIYVKEFLTHAEYDKEKWKKWL
jgi:mRNA interferase HigB